MTADPFLDLLRGATEPSPEASARLRGAVTRRVDALRRIDQMARGLGEPSSDALQRLHARIDADRPRPVRWPWGIAAAALVAAAALGYLATRPPPDPFQHVQLTVEGAGHLDHDGAQPVVVWDDGHLGVEVEPNLGVHLAVRTPEATVTVVGTGFTVERAAFATRVEVAHGQVEVTCTDGTEHSLGAGATATCLPTDPATLLRRVVALGPAGDPGERGRAIDQALASAADPAIRAELLARRVELLAPTDPEAALEAARAYLDLGVGGRRRAMLQFVATHGGAVGDPP